LTFFKEQRIIKIIPGALGSPQKGWASVSQRMNRGFTCICICKEVHKMDASTVIQAISNVGFPIAAFLLMWYQCNTVVKENTAAITEMRLALDDIKKES
jgi:hypothetical protein